MLYEFEKWACENKHKDAVKLVHDFREWRKKPLKQLFADCPWFKDRYKSIDLGNGVNFSEEEIIDLKKKGYSFYIFGEIDKSDYYMDFVSDYKYSINLDIKKEENIICQFYCELDSSDYFSIIDFFTEYSDENSKVIEA